MSLPPSPGDPYPYYPPHPPPRRGLNLGVGALLGVLVGILGPIILSLIAYAAGQGFSGGLADDIVSWRSSACPSCSSSRAACS